MVVFQPADLSTLSDPLVMRSVFWKSNLLAEDVQQWLPNTCIEERVRKDKKKHSEKERHGLFPVINENQSWLVRRKAGEKKRKEF